MLLLLFRDVDVTMYLCLPLVTVQCELTVSLGFGEKAYPTQTLVLTESITAPFDST